MTFSRLNIPPTEAIACPYAIYITFTLLILELWLNFA